MTPIQGPDVGRCDGYNVPVTPCCFIQRVWSAHAIMGLNAASELDRESRHLNVRCGFLAVYFPDLEPDEIETLPSPKDAPFELHAEFRLAYEIRDLHGIEDNDPQQFAIVNGVLARMAVLARDCSEYNGSDGASSPAGRYAEGSVDGRSEAAQRTVRVAASTAERLVKAPDCTSCGDARVPHSRPPAAEIGTLLEP